jgi:hypothetical protein
MIIFLCPLQFQVTLLNLHGCFGAHLSAVFVVCCLSGLFQVHGGIAKLCTHQIGRCSLDHMRGSLYPLKRSIGRVLATTKETLALRPETNVNQNKPTNNTYLNDLFNVRNLRIRLLTQVSQEFTQKLFVITRLLHCLGPVDHFLRSTSHVGKRNSVLRNEWGSQSDKIQVAQSKSTVSLQSINTCRVESTSLYDSVLEGEPDHKYGWFDPLAQTQRHLLGTCSTFKYGGGLHRCFHNCGSKRCPHTVIRTRRDAVRRHRASMYLFKSWHFFFQFFTADLPVQLQLTLYDY